MASILDEYVLDKDHFEEMIASGASIKELSVIFNTTITELDKWCCENYGAQLKLIYERIRNIAYREYLDIMRQHAKDRAASSAIEMVEKYIMGYQQDNTVKIVFSGAVAEESEGDKINDGNREDQEAT